MFGLFRECLEKCKQLLASQLVELPNEPLRVTTPPEGVALQGRGQNWTHGTPSQGGVRKGVDFGRGRMSGRQVRVLSYSRHFSNQPDATPPSDHTAVDTAAASRMLHFTKYIR